MFHSLRTVALAAASVGVAALATACSGSGGSSSDASPTPRPSTAAAPHTSAAAADASADGIGVSDTPSLGKLIVNSAGRTVYVFDIDAKTPGESACYADCAAKWPPVPATTSVNGIDSALLGSLTRTDGTQQLTIKNHPVHLFAGDSAASDTKGQNVKSVWHALMPDGAKITAAANSN